MNESKESLLHRMKWSRKQVIGYLIASVFIVLFFWAKDILNQNKVRFFTFLDGVASKEILVDQFEEVVFRGEFGDKNMFISKWLSPMRVVKLDLTEVEYASIIENHLNSLAKITALRHELVAEQKTANVFMRFTTLGKIMVKMKENRDFFKGHREISYTTACFARFVSKSGIIQKAGVIVTDNKAPDNPQKRSLESVSSCILEELTQSMGLPRDTERIFPSLFSEIYDIDYLSINDKIIIRTLYAKRIRPGMLKADAMAQARIIIPELIKAVDERGEEALYQQPK